MSDSNDSGSNTAIRVALIGGAATIIVALIGGLFSMMGNRENNDGGSTIAPAASGLSVRFTNPPEEIPLYEEAKFDLLCQAAVRGDWVIPRIGNGPLELGTGQGGCGESVWFNPGLDDAGQSYTLSVTVYDSLGNSATADHAFRVLDENGN